jgi:DNA polymerase III epsilon subunit-like protein
MLILDIEASGLEYDKHSIVSLGALDLDNPTYRFYMECRVWDGAHISEEALGVNGFTREQITYPSKESESELAIRFLEWSEMIGDRTLGGQNPSFDRDMLKAAIHRAHQNWTLAHRTVDSHTLCWMHMVKRGIPVPLDQQHKRSALNLDAVLVYCGIPEEPHPHNALTGAMCHAEVISRLLNDKKLLPEFDQYEMPWKR